MSYLALLSSPPAVVPKPQDRLPLRAPEELATGWALAWEQADGALVLPGDRLCVFRAPDSGVSITATPPAPGVLRITVPNSEWLAAGSSVGELRYGPALETALERQEAAHQAAQQAADRAQAALREDLARLQAGTERLTKTKSALQSELQALAPVPAAAPPETATAAAELDRFSALLEAAAGLADCDPRVRLLGLLRWEEELHAALRLNANRRPGIRQSRTVLTIQAQSALAVLYRERIDAAERNTHDFPSHIQDLRLGFWRRLRDRHRDRLKRDGPAGRTANPETEEQR